MDDQSKRPCLTLAAINIAVLADLTEYGAGHHIPSTSVISALSAFCGRVAAPQIGVTQAVCVAPRLQSSF